MACRSATGRLAEPAEQAALVLDILSLDWQVTGYEGMGGHRSARERARYELGAPLGVVTGRARHGRGAQPGCRSSPAVGFR